MEQEIERKKKLLKGYCHYERQMEILEKQAEELERDKNFQDGKFNSVKYNNICRLLQTEIKNAREKKIEQYKEICQSIGRLSDDHQKQVLYFHYMEGMTWEQVCMKMNYSWCQIHRFHKKALENLDI